MFALLLSMTIVRFSFAASILLLLTPGVKSCEPDYEDVDVNRPVVLHPIGSDLRICLTGSTNAGKTTFLNHLFGADDPTSPTIFTTRTVTARSRTIPDDRFEWLVKEFPNATLRPPTITFFDTPALLRQFDIAAWKNDIMEALHECDILFNVIQAFNNSAVQQFKSCTDEDCEYQDESVSQHVESIRVLSQILDGNDSKLASKPVVYVLNMDADVFANATSTKTFLDAESYIQGYDQGALVLPFSGRVLKDEKLALSADAAVLSGADIVVDRPIEKFQIRRFFTANEHMVAAWAFTQKTTVGEAVRLLNASVPPNNFGDVDAAGMRGVVQVNSLSPAFGVKRHIRFESVVRDGDLLLVNPGLLLEATTEGTDSSTIPASKMGSLRLAAVTNEEEHGIASWKIAASLTLNVVLLIVVAGLVAELLSKGTCKRVQARFIESRLPRPERRGDALLAGVKASIVVRKFLA